jgi:hypothetical protein
MVGLVGKNAEIYTTHEAFVFISDGSLGSLRIRTQELALGCFSLLVAFFCPIPLSLLISAAGLYAVYNGSKLYKAGAFYAGLAKAELKGNEVLNKGTEAAQEFFS